MWTSLSVKIFSVLVFYLLEWLKTLKIWSHPNDPWFQSDKPLSILSTAFDRNEWAHETIILNVLIVTMSGFITFTFFGRLCCLSGGIRKFEKCLRFMECQVREIYLCDAKKNNWAMQNHFPITFKNMRKILKQADILKIPSLSYISHSNNKVQRWDCENQPKKGIKGSPFRSFDVYREDS